MLRRKAATDPLSQLESLTAPAKANLEQAARRQRKVDERQQKVDEWDRERVAVYERLLSLWRFPPGPPVPITKEGVAAFAPFLVELADALEDVGLGDILAEPWLSEGQKKGDDEHPDMRVARLAVLAIIQHRDHTTRACESLRAHVNNQDGPVACWESIRGALESIALEAADEFRHRYLTERDNRFGDAPCRMGRFPRPEPPPGEFVPGPPQTRLGNEARQWLHEAGGLGADCRTVAKELWRLREEAMRRAQTRDANALYHRERLRSLMERTPPLPEWGDQPVINLIDAGGFLDHPRKSAALIRVAAFVHIPKAEVDEVLAAVRVIYDTIAAAPARELFPKIQGRRRRRAGPEEGTGRGRPGAGQRSPATSGQDAAGGPGAGPGVGVVPGPADEGPAGEVRGREREPARRFGPGTGTGRLGHDRGPFQSMSETDQTRSGRTIPRSITLRAGRSRSEWVTTTPHRSTLKGSATSNVTTAR